MRCDALRELLSGWLVNFWQNKAAPIWGGVYVASGPLRISDERKIFVPFLQGGCGQRIPKLQ